MNDNEIRVFKILKKAKLVTATNFLLTLKDDGISGVFKKIGNKFNAKKKSREIEILKQLEKKDDRVTIGNITKYSDNKITVDVVINSDNNFEDIKKIFLKNTLSGRICYNFIKLVEYYDNVRTKQIRMERLERLFSDRAFILVTDDNELNLEKFYYCIRMVNDENLETKIKEVFDSIFGLKLLANYNNKNCVSVKSGMFFNFEGSNYYSGGAERYLIDLYEIFKKRNINLDIYQNATKPFFRKYNGINVIGMALKDTQLYLNDDFMDRQTKHYIDLTKGKSQLHIYSAFFECYPNHVSPSIGISHGIGWDNESNRNFDAQSFWNSKKMIIDSAKECDCLVSVDTNTANWFQTVDYDIGNKKFSVIPNYVDVKEFSPRKNYTKPSEKIIIVYPRRLYKPRGLYLALEAADKILKKYKNVEFHFVGKGFKQETDDIDSYIKKYPKNIKRYSKSPFEMHEVYKYADISLVPTLYSEGTSLSCLEAMASGNVVISTRIGGLSDLVINGYNGYLIEPNAEALLNTLEYVLSNYDKQMIIKKRAVEVAKAFNKKIWIEKWEHEIDKFNLKNTSNNLGLVEFYVEDVDNISDNVFDLIRENLLSNKLIYIRSKKAKKNDNISCGLIQLIDFNDEVVNIAEKVYVEKSLKGKIERKEKILLV